MLFNNRSVAVFSAAVLIVAGWACVGDHGRASEFSGYLEATVEPCLRVAESEVNPCERRPSFRWEDASFGGIDLPLVPPDYEMKLNAASSQTDLHGGTRFDLLSAVHMVVRGHAVEDSLECETYAQLLPDWALSGEGAGFFRAETYAEFGGVPQMFYVCHSQFLVHEYLIGTGPPRLIVAHLDVALPYDPTLMELNANDFGALVDLIVNPAISTIHRSEWVLWLSPSMMITHEAFQVTDYWDLQRREDGEIVAVSPWFSVYEISGYSSEYGPEHRYLLEPTLDELRQHLRAANEARMVRTSGRVGVDEDTPMLVTDANKLRDYFEEIGAYDNPYATPAPPPR